MRIIGKAILFVIEYAFRIAAPLAAGISLGTIGSFGEKVSRGFQSLPDAIREIIWWFKNVPQIGRVLDDYNSMTAANFNSTYGTGAVNNVMAYLNEGVNYLQQVYLNLAQEPLLTVVAVMVVFLVFFLFARIARFVRQQGQGSFIDRYERKAGNWVFKRSPSPYENRT